MLNDITVPRKNVLVLYLFFIFLFLAPVLLKRIQDL